MASPRGRVDLIARIVLAIESGVVFCTKLGQDRWETTTEIVKDSDRKRKARAARDRLEDREYVAIGTELPADHHVPYEDRAAVVDLLREFDGDG